MKLNDLGFSVKYITEEEKLIKEEIRDRLSSLPSIPHSINETTTNGAVPELCTRLKV
jgi:hypothetical protein